MFTKDARALAEYAADSGARQQAAPWADRLRCPMRVPISLLSMLIPGLRLIIISTLTASVAHRLTTYPAIPKCLFKPYRILMTTPVPEQNRAEVSIIQTAYQE